MINDPHFSTLHQNLIKDYPHLQTIVTFPIMRGSALNVSLYTFSPAGSHARKPYPRASVGIVDPVDVLKGYKETEWEPEVIQILSVSAQVL